MRNLFLIVTCLLGIWPVVTALANHPLSSITMWRQTYVAKPGTANKWTLVNPNDKTPFDLMQEDLKIVAQFKQILREKAKHATPPSSAAPSGLGSVGGIGAVGGIAAPGNPNVAKTTAELLAEVTPEEAAAALADDYAVSHPKSFKDIFLPHSNKMRTLEIRVFGKTKRSEFTGFNLAQNTAPGTPPPAATPPSAAEKPTPTPVPENPAPRGNGAIGGVGGIGKVGPNQ